MYQRNVTELEGKQPDNTAHAFVRRDLLNEVLLYFYETVRV
jgi:hypothetical protein